MKQISLWFALFSCTVMAGLLPVSCTKENMVLDPQSLSKTSTPAVEKTSTTTPAADPAITYITFGNIPAARKLTVMNADGSNQTFILTAVLGRPSWSPDGHSILFGGTIGGVSGFWIVDISVVNGTPTGSNLHQILSDIPAAGDARFSPFGDLIVYVNDRNICTIPLTGGTPTIVYTSPTGFYPVQPHYWNQDASKLVFIEQEDLSPYRNQLLVLDLNTFPSQVTTVLPLSNFFLNGPAWSRIDDRIAYSVNVSGSNVPAIYTVTVDFNKTPVIIGTPVKVIDAASFPTWSPDDSKLAYWGGKKSGINYTPIGVFTYSFSTKTVKNLTGSGGSDAGWPDWRKF